MMGSATMADLDPAAPRFPHLAASDGHYESYFLKGHHATEPRAFWMRHTVHQRPGAPPTAAVWLTVFDAHAAEPVVAGKHTVGAEDLAAPPGAYARVGAAEVRPGRAAGSLASPTLDAEWSLGWRAEEEPLRHLPAGWMYTAPVPRTKSVTPHPGARFEGTLTAAGREHDLTDWIGVVSHNWGSEHAERWIWMHCGQFEGRGADTWLELVLGRIRLGPFVLPWLGNGVLSLDGTRHRLGGPQRARQTKVDEHPRGARLVLTGDEGARIEGEVAAPAERFVAWRYADPDGPEHHSLHSSLADLRFEVRLPGRAPLELHAPAAASFELGLRETDHGIHVQPYDDG
jgi:hypothetical protein